MVSQKDKLYALDVLILREFMFEGVGQIINLNKILSPMQISIGSHSMEQANHVLMTNHVHDCYDSPRGYFTVTIPRFSSCTARILKIVILEFLVDIDEELGFGEKIVVFCIHYHNL